MVQTNTAALLALLETPLGQMENQVQGLAVLAKSSGGKNLGLGLGAQENLCARRALRPPSGRSALLKHITVA